MKSEPVNLKTPKEKKNNYIKSEEFIDNDHDFSLKPYLIMLSYLIFLTVGLHLTMKIPFIFAFVTQLLTLIV